MPTFLLWPVHELWVWKLAQRVETAELVAGLWASQPWRGGCQDCSLRGVRKAGPDCRALGTVWKRNLGKNLTSWVCGEKYQPYLLINELKTSSSQNLPDWTYGLARPKPAIAQGFCSCIIADHKHSNITWFENQILCPLSSPSGFEFLGIHFFFFCNYEGKKLPSQKKSCEFS